jgi:diaminohydroxyphosphoribosylaminopyrimidine deaminase/5-amino-6-(5-phosphoribosylamino)uracil reductase
MAAALRLAARGLGDTWPNPSVGCVLVKDGVVIGRGVTQSGGRPHAEQVALERAGAAAKGATAYVSLEPCSHHGKTPPCADALVKAGVRRVVVGATDPDPRVSGGGMTKLKAAGIAVEEAGPWNKEAATLNRGFFLTQTAKRPLVALKTATGLDGRIAMASGESQWITGPVARAAGHRLRASYDAIAVGSGTVLADDPELTCRMESYGGRSKVRVVFDRRLRLPAASKLATAAKSIPTWVITTPEGAQKARSLISMGVDVLPVEGVDFVTEALAVLAARGLTRLMIEGGGQLAAAFLKAGVVDEIAWFRAGRVMGGDGRPAIGSLTIDKLAATPAFSRLYSLALGPDWLDMFARD